MLLDESPVIHIKGRISNAYLINGERLALVDTGSPNDWPAIKTAVRTLGRSIDEIGLLIPTHAHIDHIGNAPAIKRITGARILLPAKRVSPFLALVRGVRYMIDNIAPTYATLKNNPLLFLHLHKQLNLVKADIISHDGMELPGHPGWICYRTPGHSPEGISLYHAPSRSLITGDTVIVLDGRPSLPTGILSRRSMRRSLERLKALPVEHLYPGHGTPLHEKHVLDQLQLP